MNFNTAFISMKQGHKVQRSCWKGYWKIENGEIIMYTKEGEVVNIRDSKDMMYTISNMLCDDWQICDESGFDIKLNINNNENDIKSFSERLNEIAKEKSESIKNNTKKHAPMNDNQMSIFADLLIPRDPEIEKAIKEQFPFIEFDYTDEKNKVIDTLRKMGY